MLKKYDTTQSSWVDVTTIKRYDTTQQAWVDVGSAKRYNTEQSSWEEAAYQFMSLESALNEYESSCDTVEDGLGVYCVFSADYSSSDNFVFRIDGLNVKGSVLKLDIESNSEIGVTVIEYTGTSSQVSSSLLKTSGTNELTLSNSYTINSIELHIKSIYTSYSGTATGYVRNVEIDGIKYKFPNVSI